METETYRPARIILLGEHATREQRRETSLDALVGPSSPPFFLWHTAEDIYVPPEHTYRLAAALADNNVPHAVHVFAHGPHSLGLATGAGDAAGWTALAASWIADQTGVSEVTAAAPGFEPHVRAMPPAPQRRTLARRMTRKEM
jgi:acetyl esterase/lipase